MKLTIIYGTEHEVAKLTRPVINELMFELNLDAMPVIIKLPSLDAEQVSNLRKAMDESEADHALVFVSDMAINSSHMLELITQFPFIESFRSARAPFRMASFISPDREPAKPRVLH